MMSCMAAVRLDGPNTSRFGLMLSFLPVSPTCEVIDSRRDE